MLIGIIVLSGIITGCEVKTNSKTDTESLLATGDLFTRRDMDASYESSESICITLDDENSSCDSEAVSFDGQTVTITEAGIYRLNGTLSDGSVVIDVSDSEKVQLILENVTIINEKGPAVYVRKADKTFLTLAENSENNIVSNGIITEDEKEIDAAIFAKDDLTINGNGTLNLASAAHGIVCKDDLVIAEGTYYIKAEKQGISGKDSVRIANGDFEIVSGGDAVHSENEKDTENGFVYIADGNFVLNTDGDGISASYVIQLEDGNFTIVTGNGSDNQNAGNQSVKGIKASVAVQINGGIYKIDSADDSIHSNGDVFVNEGVFELYSGDDGIHADNMAEVSGGTIRIRQCYEGIEGQSVSITSGTIDISASDDGINAAGGKDRSNNNGPGGGDMFQADEDACISISGGKISIKAKGDGIDSNGDLMVSGGIILVTGPANNGNSALDYDGTATITGGTVVAAGMSGMAQNFGEDSTQGSMLINLGDTRRGKITLTNANGEDLVSYTPYRRYDSVVISCAELEKGETYTLHTGDVTTEITLSELIYRN